MSFSWIAVLNFIFSLALNAISLSMLIRIKKHRYNNLWKKDKKEGTFWIPYERKLLRELMLNTPFWVNQEKDAKVWLWILRLSIIPVFISWFLVFYLNGEFI
jgi:hypothetical protein